jgi:hypothetical protein
VSQRDTGVPASSENRKVQRPAGKELRKGSAEKAASKPPAAEKPSSKDAAAGRPVKQDAAAERPSRKEAAAGRPARGAAPAEQVVKKEAPAVGEVKVKKELVSAERPGKKDAAGKLPAADERPAKARLQPQANGRPTKPEKVVKPPAAAAAATAALVKQDVQQEHAGSNPSSLRGEDGGAEARPQQQATSPPGADLGSTSLGTPCEVLLAPRDTPRPLGELVIASCRGHADLWAALQTRFGGELGAGLAVVCFAALVHASKTADTCLTACSDCRVPARPCLRCRSAARWRPHTPAVSGQ